MSRPFLLLVLSLLLLLPSARPLPFTPSRSGIGTEAVATRVVWFRDHALRVRDNDAVSAAVAGESDVHCSIVPVYLWKSPSESLAPVAVDAATGGTASDVFVANALGHLNRTLGGGLSLGIVGSSESPDEQAKFYTDELANICRGTGASEVYYLESHNDDLEDALRRHLRDDGLLPVSFGGGHTLLDYSEGRDTPPWKAIIEGHPFRSPLIPFVDYVLDKLRANPPAEPKPHPLGLEESIADKAQETVVTNPVTVHDLWKVVGFTQTGHHWGSPIAKAWPASEEDAATALESFLDSLGTSDEQTQTPGQKKTHLASRLSPYLARGLLAPKQVYRALLRHPLKKERASFVRRICWRDYTYAVAALFPEATYGRPIREGYSTAEQETEDVSPRKATDRRLLRLWKDGATGFPLVDAGMRQLASEGWMPQKVRLAVGTCLVEGLGGSWREGMDHFAEYLVDYDPAINANMWMNAGCVGFDPYYVGGEYKRRPYWDEDGEYVRRWCPELSNLPDSWDAPEAERGIGTFQVDCLYEPWSAPGHVLENAGVTLGGTYPHRCCNERSARRRFFQGLRDRRETWPPSKTDEQGRDVVRLGRHEGCELIGMFTPRVLLSGKKGKPKQH